MKLMSLRDYRTGRAVVRKGTSKGVRSTKTHELRRTKKREDDRSIIDDVMKEWADDYDGNHDIFA